jgi:hypothetical protein
VIKARCSPFTSQCQWLRHPPPANASGCDTHAARPNHTAVFGRTGAKDRLGPGRQFCVDMARADVAAAELAELATARAAEVRGDGRPARLTAPPQLDCGTPRRRPFLSSVFENTLLRGHGPV